MDYIMSKNGSILDDRILLLAYYFVMFGILAGLNIQTGLQDNSWGGSGSNNLATILDNPSMDNIEVWYMFAGIIFLIPIPVFVGLFVYYYHPSRINVQNKRRIILEFFYLSVAAGFSMVALLLPRLFLAHYPKVHPTYVYQVNYLNQTGKFTMDYLNQTGLTMDSVSKTGLTMDYLNQTALTMKDWFWDFPADTQIDDGLSSVLKIGIYFVIFITLIRIRKLGNH